ncbi:MAG: lysine 2 3-aminomutase [Fusobacteria bacterium]|nr:MAG: lysine 2 3-aminomutase [Fusobacteriota bacterium]KAF0230261.1 MAG: lysine 2 [Fusobacteriota bacterium]
MSFDKIDNIENTSIQHGELSNRVYIMSLDSKNTSKIIEIVENLARSNEYTKIIVKVPERSVKEFIANDYIEEAQIPDMFHGVETGYFMCKYYDEARRIDKNKDYIDEILDESLKVNKKSKKEKREIKIRKIEKMTNEDITDMIQLYSQVFESYPFPITNQDYIAITMHEQVDYYGVRIKGKLVAIASAECDYDSNYAELTDFGVLQDYRQQGLAGQLLEAMEKDLKEKDILTYFTIARAKSIGMNKTFSNNKYTYAGTLVNNTNIAGEIESMNVWYKSVNQNF